MKRYIILIIVLLFSSLIANAQLWKIKRYEVTAGVGTTQFFGDLGGYPVTENILGFRDISLKQTGFNISTGLRYRFLEDIALRVNFAYGYLKATDSFGSETFKVRGFEATTSIFEPTIIGEYYFIKNKTENSYIFSKGRGNVFRTFISALDFYMFAGIGGLSYKVKGNDALVANGMRTDGFAMTFPIGLGTNYTLSTDFNLGLEIGGRYPKTDYLEGFTAQYSKYNDVYYFMNITLTYKIKTANNGLPAFIKK